MTALLVALGAAVGAPLRYVVDRLLQARDGAFLPWGTLLVNVVGSFVLGVVAARLDYGTASPQTLALLGTGFCGALTTYSTFGYETVRLVERGAYRLATLNVVLSLVLGCVAALIGYGAGAWLA